MPVFWTSSLGATIRTGLYIRIVYTLSFQAGASVRCVIVCVIFLYAYAVNVWNVDLVDFQTKLRNSCHGLSAPSIFLGGRFRTSEADTK